MGRAEFNPDNFSAWRFKELLTERGITPYKLAQYLQDHEEIKVSRTAIYNLAKRPPQLLEWAVIERVMQGAADLSGESVKLSDIVELERTPRSL